METARSDFSSKSSVQPSAFGYKGGDSPANYASARAATLKSLQGFIDSLDAIATGFENLINNYQLIDSHAATVAHAMKSS